MKLLRKIKNTYSRVWMLCWLQALFAVFGFIGESVAGRFVLNLTFVLQFSLLIVALNFHLKALKNLLNSFWSLTFLLLPFYVIALSRNYFVLDNQWTATWYAIAAVLLALVAWQISTPLYYPMIQWWEYDFRFRPDIKIEVDVDSEHSYDARLSDLRRSGGCVVMFQSVPVGTVFTVKTDVVNNRFKIKAEVISRKEPILGRGFIYGVKFQSEDLEQKQRLKLLVNYWYETKKSKSRSKLEAVKS
jgi:hypothetical protein